MQCVESHVSLRPLSIRPVCSEDKTVFLDVFVGVFFFVMMKNIYVFRKLISNMAVNMYFSKIINWPEERNEPFAPRVSSD